MRKRFVEDGPRDDLASHFVPWVDKVSSETEIGYLELPVGCYEQIVRFEILCIATMSEKKTGAVSAASSGSATNSVQDEVTVAKLQPSKRHGHPALDVSWEKNQCAIPNNKFQVRVEEFQDKVQVCLR